jgi:hypothetical protein
MGGLSFLTIRDVDQAPDKNADYHKQGHIGIKAKFHQSRDKDLSKHQGK